MGERVAMKRHDNRRPVRKCLPSFGRAALDRKIDVCEDRAFETPLIAIIARHGRDCRLGLVTDNFGGRRARIIERPSMPLRAKCWRD